MRLIEVKSMLDALKDVVRKSSIHVCLINTEDVMAVILKL